MIPTDRTWSIVKKTKLRSRNDIRLSLSLSEPHSPRIPQTGMNETESMFAQILARE